MVGSKHPHPPTARLQEIRRLLMLFKFSVAELEFFAKDIELEVRRWNPEAAAK